MRLKLEFGSLLIDSIYERIDDGYILKFFRWVINSKYRRAINLSNWLNTQVENSRSDKLLVDAYKAIKNYKDVDTQMMSILKYVKKTIKYTGDKKVWNMAEYWQTASKTIELKTGDCEDGAILMYVLARMKNVPVSRIKIVCGNVQGGGHAWLAYTPTNYPLNFAFMDWCYWTTYKGYDTRDLYYVHKNKIYGYGRTGFEKKVKYYSTWFFFNEEKTVSNITYKIRHR